MAKKRKKPRRRQKKREDIPANHHVARYCNKQRVDRHPLTDAVRGVFPGAFELRSKQGENYLSLQCFERFAGDVDQQYQGVLAAFRKAIVVGGTSPPITAVVPKAAVARLNCGAVVKLAQGRGHDVRMRDRSSKEKPGYVGFEGLPLDNSDQEMLAAFANECCLEVREVQEIDALYVNNPPGWTNYFPLTP